MKAKTTIALSAFMAATIGYNAEDLNTIREIANAHDVFELDNGDDYEDFTLVQNWEFIEWS